MKGTQQPALFSAHVYCGHGRPSQLLLSSCRTSCLGESHGHSGIKSKAVSPKTESQCSVLGCNLCVNRQNLPPVLPTMVAAKIIFLHFVSLMCILHPLNANITYILGFILYLPPLQLAVFGLFTLHFTGKLLFSQLIFGSVLRDYVLFMGIFK